MFRITIISLAALASISIASAGEIQIGGSTGLTNAYITSGGCSGAGPCVTGSIGSSTTEQNYDTTLFSGFYTGSPYTGYNQTTAEKGTLTDPTSGVVFSMIDDGTSGGNSNNFWELPEGGSPVQQITIPIGVYAVTDVWTLMNDIASDAGMVGATVIFNFGTTSNASTVDSISVKLTNTNNSATAAGSIRNSIDCSPATTTPCEGTATPAIGPFLSSTTYNSGAITVDADNVFSHSFGDSQSGTVNLDDQGFFFNGISLAALGTGDTNLNTYLVSIQIKESTTMPAGAAAALSAVTVDTVPEPSTVFLVLAGLGCVGFGAFRRKKA